MDIPVNVDVECTDGQCGHCTHVILNPVTEQVTHIVVREGTAPHIERLVPLEWIDECTSESICLRCTYAELTGLEPFIDTEFVRTEIPRYAASEYKDWPYVRPEQEALLVRHERIPVGELAVRRGARVAATDGPIGRVDEFMVDPASEHITHLVLREGHLWGQKDVSIPVSYIDRIEANTVYLNVDKHSIDTLPPIPIRRRRRP
jgi:sporulation protein YlmC with PRC-barrel domain